MTVNTVKTVWYLTYSISNSYSMCKGSFFSNKHLK